VGRDLEHGPCLTLDCRGRLRRSPREGESFYRTLYGTTDMRRVDAREHTSLLDGAERREIEAGFKRPEQRPGDPNVLVATPTLEMGIDIGDLSTVMLSSLPDSVAKYQQRVGRGGRLPGSSLSLAYVTGRGENLPRLGEPTSLINGAVRPPATYLDAEEILQRQFLASVLDRMIREGHSPMPRTAGEALASTAPGTLLGELIARIHRDGPALLDAFTSGFTETDTPGLAALREWVLGHGPASAAAAEDAARSDIPRSAEATICHAVGEHVREVEDLRRRRREIEASIPDLEQQDRHPAATDEDKRALRSAYAGLRLLKKVLADLTGDTWIAGLELRGLLPNYSLMDDSVQLDAQVSWIDPDTGDFDLEPLIIDRGSSRALTELAPGAHFYARRLEMRVDGVELGQDNADIHTHVACDRCGCVIQLASSTEASPRTCPRCGSAGIAETGQRFEAARLVRVFSDIRRDDASIGDDSDERRRTRFEVVIAADFDPARRVGQWSVESVGLGVAHYRRMTVRWFNMGRDVPSPETMDLAGTGVTAQLLRICEACGKLDSGSGGNHEREHRAWCRYRKSGDEHTRSLALSRELVTQGVAISLPPAVVDDMHSTPALAAAVQLGLREVMGGAPGHLRVEIVPHPVDAAHGETRQALFLHDTVPGGTGYLTELATPARLWPILVRAAQVLDACPCADEGRGSCHRCLAPFGRDVYRIDALRALKALLGVDGERTVADLDPDQPEWTVTEAPLAPDSGESHLEQRFRAALAQRLTGIATVKSSPTPHGPALTITGLGERPWFLQPQVDIDGVRPDFVLSSPGLPQVSIFTDGHTFHATPAHNRLADDATKRARLRDSHGHRVIAVTHDDLESPTPPTWLDPMVLTMLMGLPAGKPGAGISHAAVGEHEGGALSLLEGLVRDPDSRPRTALSNALGLLVSTDRSRTTQGQIDRDDDLVSVAAHHALTGDVPTSGSTTAVLYRDGALVFASRISHGMVAEVALILDDTDEAVADPDYARSWREWLRLSNVLAFATIPFTITTVRAAASTAPEVDVIAPPDGVTVDVAADLPGAWASADLDPEYASALVIRLARLLAEAGVPVAEIGAEIETGSVVELSWPTQKVAVVLDDVPNEDIAEMRAAGWSVHVAAEGVDALTPGITASLAGDGLVGRGRVDEIN